jgi:hypothetical protein
MAENQTTIGDLWDEAWMKVRTIAGSCSASQGLEEIKDLLKKGQQYSDYASLLTKGDESSNLKSASEALGNGHDVLDKVKNLCLDVKAIGQIQDAMKVLNNPDNMNPPNDAAARAFGQLFVGAGRFLGKAGPPASVYAPILENAGDFFVNMKRAWEPWKLEREKGIWEGLDKI